MPLKDQAIHAAKWTTITTIASQLLTFIISIIKFRLLAVELFGIMAIVNAFISIMRMVQTMGFGPAIVQKQEINKTFINSVFWIVFGISVFLALLLVSFSWYISSFYNLEILVILLIIASVQFVLNSFSTIQNYLMARELRFKTIGLIGLASSIGGGIVTIILAFFDYGIWSLVFGSITSTILTMLLYFIYTNWVPSLIFEWESIKKSVNFSVSITLLKTIAMLRMTAPELIIGKFLGSETLGFFTFARNIMQLVIKNVDAMVSSLLFPLFSKLQKDSVRIVKGYIKVNYYTLLVTLPIVFGFLLFARNIIVVVYGEKWLPAINVAQILMFATLIHSIYDKGSSLFAGIGKPNILLKLELVIFLPVVVSFLIFVQYGLIYFVIIMLIERFITFVIQLSLLKKTIGLNIVSLMKSFSKPLFASFLMLVILFITNVFITPNVNSKLNLGLMILMGMVIYCITILAIDRKEIFPTIKMLLNLK